MAELSQTPAERARKAHASVLQAMQDPGTARNVAQVLGVSESTVSRIKTEKLEDSIVLLYQLGFKVVSSDRICVDQSKYAAMVTIARAAMADEATAQRLIWDDEA